MQSPEERINIIRDAVENIQVVDNSLDLNNVSFAAISDRDNSELTRLMQKELDKYDISKLSQ